MTLRSRGLGLLSLDVIANSNKMLHFTSLGLKEHSVCTGTKLFCLLKSGFAGQQVGMFMRGGGVRGALSPWGNQVRVRAVCQSTAWNLGALAAAGELRNLTNFCKAEKMHRRGMFLLENCNPTPNSRSEGWRIRFNTGIRRCYFSSVQIINGDSGEFYNRGSLKSSTTSSGGKNTNSH